MLTLQVRISKLGASNLACAVEWQLGYRVPVLRDLETRQRDASEGG
jgi:hypothetical protein